MLESKNITRLPATGVNTAANYVLTNPAHRQWANMKAITDAGGAATYLGVGGNVGGGRRYRGVRMQFFGTGADGNTFNVKIYAARFIENTGGDPYVYLQLLGTAAVTLSAAAGAAGLPVTDAQLVADGISFTADADYTQEITDMGAQAASVVAGSDTPATLRMSELGNAAALVFDFDMVTATGGGVLVEALT
ncbi:MAG: hypothetical protein JSS51_03530 [Planctomycetes bacterium]|nr:hypothetical protein [Planctomycetota bacterium]